MRRRALRRLPLWDYRPTMKGEERPQSQDWSLRDGTRPPAEDPGQRDKGLELTEHLEQREVLRGG